MGVLVYLMRMNRKSRAVVGTTLLIAACKTATAPEALHAPTLDAGFAAPSAPSTAPAAVPSSATPAAAANEPALGWGTRPGREGSLFPVADGMCVHMESWAVANAVLLTYGSGAGPWTRGGRVSIARFTPEGIDVGDAALAGFDDAKEPRLNALQRIGGSYPSNLWALNEQSGRAYNAVDVLTRTEGPWKVSLPGAAPAARNRWSPQSGKDGALLFLEASGQGDGPEGAVLLRAVAVGGSAPKLPAALAYPSTNARVVRALPTGEVFVLIAGKATTVRYTLDGTKTVDATMATGDFEANLHVLAADAVYLSAGPALRRLEGTTFKETALGAAATAKHAAIRELARDPEGNLWAVLEGGSILVEKKGGGVEDRGLGEPVFLGAGAVGYLTGRSLAGVEGGDPWAVGKSGKVYRYDGTKWASVEMPAPPWSMGAKYNAVRVLWTGKNDVFVNAEYGEKGAGWKTPERYRAVLRSVRPSEVQRCNEPVGEAAPVSSGRGFRSWPPLATDACATPFVVVFGEDALKRVNGKYPRIEAQLKAHAELGKHFTAVDFASGGRKWMGLAVKTRAEGLKIAELWGSKLGERPEVVCGTPPAPVTHEWSYE